MRKKHDEAWAEEMRDAMPPAGYRMTLAEGCTLAYMEDCLFSVSAAYNYGFRRGRNYERARARAGKRRE